MGSITMGRTLHGGGGGGKEKAEEEDGVEHCVQGVNDGKIPDDSQGKFFLSLPSSISF